MKKNLVTILIAFAALSATAQNRHYNPDVEGSKARHHVDTSQVHRYHVDTSQVHRYHVDTSQVHRYHVDTSQVHRYHVDTSQVHRLMETTTLLYPNPASVSEGFTLQYNAENEMPLEVLLYDATGRELRRSKFETTTGSNRFQLSTSELHPGAYLLIIRQGERVTRGKMVLY